MEQNGPDLWRIDLPRPATHDHKYDRGHAVIMAAPDLTGATRLAATAASRVGAGLVTVLARDRADVYREALPPDIMVAEGSFAALNRVTAVAGGSGGLSDRHETFLSRLPEALAVVLDAGAVEASICEEGDRPLVLTPHEGEFARAFPELEGPRHDRAAAAAKARCGVVVLKGAETVIAAPDGRLVINRHASPYLAKAGTGDVLTGMIVGLMAQGMKPFAAACAAVWMHGEAGKRIGPGLVAGDIETRLPAILAELFKATA
ncbi:MAG: NAD(P)H-hydrate dehydratase [Pseudomonadota bacterium]